MLTVANLLEKEPCSIHSIVTTLGTFALDFRQKEELIKELVKSDKEAKEMKKQYSEKIKSMKQELEKAKRELEESKKTLEGCESKANYEVSEKQKVESEYKKKLQTVEAKLQALKRKQKVRIPWVLFLNRWKLLSMHVKLYSFHGVCVVGRNPGIVSMSQISKGVPCVILLLLIGTCSVWDHSRLFRP